MRTIVIGDVHGCLEELEELMDKVNYQRGQDEIVFVGDLMDRGPDPVGVVHYVRQMQANNPDVVCVQGNHEEKHVRWARHEKKRIGTGKKNPMSPFDEKKLREHNALRFDDLQWMEKLPTMHEITPGWVVVHGGMEAGRHILDQIDKSIIRCRYVDPRTGYMISADDPYAVPEGAVHWGEAWPGPENVIYGHFCERLGEVMIRGKATEKGQFAVYGIDTGCCFGGSLTAMVMEWLDFCNVPPPTRAETKTLSGPKISFVQVQAKAEYKAFKGGRD